MVRSLHLAFCAFITLSAACSLVVGTGDLDRLTDTDASGDAAFESNASDVVDVVDGAMPDAGMSDAGVDAYVCPNKGGAMVEIPDAGYCIDSTEVTRGAYQMFLASNPSTSGQLAECAWNTSFTPTGGDFNTPGDPINYIDWCDGYAFCKWAGKRMCGRIGGGTLPYGNTYNDPSLSQWYRACSQAGARAYPYGSAFVEGACNVDDEAGVGTIISAGANANCVGGYPGIFDMVGNVEEFQDSCASATGASDPCLLQAGSYAYPSGGVSAACDFNDSDQRDYKGSDVGVRCCWP